jgi:hypothetical protein
MRRNWWIFLAIVVVATLFYAALPVLFPPESSIVDDSLEYAAQAESVNPASWFHPHHLLNNFTHRLLWLALGGENQPIRIIYLMRWTSHLGMGIALGFIFLIALALGASSWRALSLVALLMFGCMFWVFGSVAEVVAPSLAMFLAVLWGLFYRDAGKQPSIHQVIFWGWLYGLAITWNQIDLIYLPALWLGLCGYRRGTRLKSITVFTITSALWVFVAYLAVVLAVRNPTESGGLFSFSTIYARWGVWGKGNLASLPTSWQHLLLVQSFSFLRWELMLNGPFALGASLATIALLLAGLWGWISARNRERDWRLDWGWMALFGFIAVGFITWWQADAWDFWVMPWAILMLGWAGIKGQTDKFIVPALLAFTVLIGAFNLVRMEMPRREEAVNPYYSVLIAIKEQGLSDCHELMTANPHLWRYAWYWGRIEHAGFYPDDWKGNFSLMQRRKINKQFHIYLTGSDTRPLLVDKAIYDYLKPVNKDMKSRIVTEASFEGIDLDIYEIRN